VLRGLPEPPDRVGARSPEADLEELDRLGGRGALARSLAAAG